MIRPAFCLLFALALLFGCSDSYPSSEPDATEPTVQVDLPDYFAEALTGSGFAEACLQVQNEAEDLRALLVAQGDGPEPLTWGNTFGEYRVLTDLLYYVQGAAEVLDIVHPDPAVRDAAEACQIELDGLAKGLWQDATVLSVLSKYAGQNPVLSLDRQNYLDRTLWNLQEALLPEEERARIEIWNQQLAVLRAQYMDNIGVQDWQGNIGVLGDILDLRHRKAEAMGFRSWADYRLAGQMVGSREDLRAFLDQVHSALPPVEDGGFQLPEETEAEIREYLSLDGVLEGLFRLAGELYNLRFEPAGPSPVHEAIRSYDVYEAEVSLGRLYLDLLPREGKFREGAFSAALRPTSERRGGRQFPVVLMECNLMESEGTLDLEAPYVLFHEFGHVLHYLFSERTRIDQYFPNDFQEVPSTLQESWRLDRTAVDLFARHGQSGAPMPEDLFDLYREEVTAQRLEKIPTLLRRADLDLSLHERPGPVDVAQVAEEVSQRHGYPVSDRTLANWPHIVSGYDSRYYTYLWSQAVATDVLQRFQGEGMLNAGTAADWQAVLIRGGEDIEGALTAFLGRRWSLGPFLEWLRKES